MLAISVIIGVSLMVSSFRHTINLWLEQSLQGDIYISTPGPTATTPSVPVSPQVVQAVQAWPGIRRVDVQRSVDVDSPQGSIHISATTNFTIAQERTFLSIVGSKATLWERLQAGGVLITEPLANRLGIPRKIPAGGAAITLFTSQGAHTFQILGVYYDYSTPQGMVYMPLDLYRRWWDDPAITGIALRLQPGVDQDQTARSLQDRLPGRQSLLIRPNRTLRQDVLVVFDRTFAITRALQLLATVVAFIGVLSAVLSLELERQRELGILRALALTGRQIWGLVLLETGLLGVAAGLLAIPTGFLLSLILIEVINRRSFGWTLRLQVSPLPFLGALGIAVLAAVLAGIYPAWRTSKMQVAEALRSE
jgi:putative ABC transport system permease protein